MEQPPEFIKKLEETAENMQKRAFQRKQQPISPFGAPYIGFQSRMWAATLDSVVLLITVIPISFWLTNLWVGYVDVSLTPLQVVLESVPDPVERSRIISEFMTDPVRLYYMMVNTLLQLGGMFMYCMWFWKRYGATPGKMLTQQKVVVLETGENLNYSQGFLRCMGYLVGSIPVFLGIIWIAFDKQRQGWHDKIAGSVVISSKKT